MGSRTASRGSSFQSLTVQGKKVLQSLVVCAAAEALVVEAVQTVVPPQLHGGNGSCVSAPEDNTAWVASSSGAGVSFASCVLSARFVGCLVLLRFVGCLVLLFACCCFPGQCVVYGCS